MKREEVKVPRKYRARVTEDAYRDGYMAGYEDKALTEGMICASVGLMFDSLRPMQESERVASGVCAAQNGARRLVDSVRLAEARMGRAPSLQQRLRRMEKEQKP